MIALRHPHWHLIGAGAVLLAVVLLAAMAWGIDHGAGLAIDRSVLLALRHGTAHGVPVGPRWLARAMIDLTALGSATVLTLVVVAVVGFLAVRRRWLTLLLVVGGTVSGSLAVALAKSLVGRARPTMTDHLVQISSASFPSGHAANSAIIYGTIAALLTQLVDGRAARRFIAVVTVVLVAAIGFSRMYLGVHWPSDVVAGWAFGALWALAWWALGAALRLRRAGLPVDGAP